MPDRRAPLPPFNSEPKISAGYHERRDNLDWMHLRSANEDGGAQRAQPYNGDNKAFAERYVSLQSSKYR